MSFKLEKTRITSRLITFFAAEPKKKKKRHLESRIACAVTKYFHFLQRSGLWLFKLYLLQICDNMKNAL